MSTITRNQFINQLSANHGVIDVNNLSNGLKQRLEANGLSENALKEIAGPDGQIKGKSEFQKLYKAVDRYEEGRSKVFDTQIETCGGKSLPTTEGLLFQALKKEVDLNRLKLKYMEPGLKRAKPQPQLKADTDALIVPPEQRKGHVILDVPHTNQTSLYPSDDPRGQKACREAAVKQLNDYNKAHKRPSELNGADQTIQVAFQEDKRGRLKTDPTQAKIALEYIDKKLDNGQPILVGTSQKQAGINHDKMTDHFVTILGRGYDIDGRLYYQYRDPGAAKEHSIGKFYVDENTGKLFKEGDHADQQRFVRQMDYEVTQVRTYKGD